MIFGVQKSNLKKSLIGGPVIDCFEPIFGFLMQFGFSQPSGRSEADHDLLRQKVRQRISVIPENWHFNSSFVLKTLLRFFEELFDVIIDDPFLTL